MGFFSCSCNWRRNASIGWESAANNADIVTLDQEAKMIGAAAKQLASTGLGECARRIEEAAAKGDFDQVKRDLGMLRQEIQSLEALTT